MRFEGLICWVGVPTDEPDWPRRIDKLSVADLPLPVMATLRWNWRSTSEDKLASLDSLDHDVRPVGTLERVEFRSGGAVWGYGEILDHVSGEGLFTEAGCGVDLGSLDARYEEEPTMQSVSGRLLGLTIFVADGLASWRTCRVWRAS